MLTQYTCLDYNENFTGTTYVIISINAMFKKIKYKAMAITSDF